MTATRDALTCLRDAHPEALHVVAWLAPSWPMQRGIGVAGDWAYLLTRRGLRHQTRATWPGWGHLPGTLTSWAQLRRAITADPRRPVLTAWADTLTAAGDGWMLARPRTLGPQRWPDQALEAEQAHPAYPARMRAWRLTLAILDTAIEATP